MAPDVDAAVVADVGTLIDAIVTSNPAMLAALRRAWDELRRPQGTGTAEARLRHLIGEQERARKRLANAAIALVDGSLDKAGYDAARQQIESDLHAADTEAARVRAELSQAATELPDFDDVLAELRDWHEVIDASQLVTRRRIISSLIRRVEPLRIGRGHYEAGIDWTPLGKALWQIAQRTTPARSTPRAR